MNEAKFREAERIFWESAGLTPTEQWIDVAYTGTRARVQEVGEGEPVLFIHGGPNSGSTWVPMLKHFKGFRSLLVDRPNTGLSEPHPIHDKNLADYGARFVGDVLDGLGLEKAHVVASSFGGHLAIRSAAHDPSRFLRMVQMAAPAATPGNLIPSFMNALKRGWMRKIITLLPPSPRMNRSIFRQMGHGYSMDHSKIDPGMFTWYLALQKYTDTMKHDGDMIGHVIPHLDDVLLTNEVLSRADVPTLFLWGVEDGFGGEASAKLTSGPMPQAELVMMPNAGHLPWLDEPQWVAEQTAAFLSTKP